MNSGDCKSSTEYERTGYRVFANYFTASEMEQLQARALSIVTEFDDTQHRSIFSTRDQHQFIDQYFLDSANTVRCFFEEDAFSDRGMLKQSRELSINKIGHALHRLDPVFQAFSHQARLGTIAMEMGIHEPQLRQSMYIFKQPGIGGEVRWHQDATFFYTDPVTVTTFWIAIEDTNLENGCLWVEPGGHRGPLREWFHTAEDGKITTDILDPSPWPSTESTIPLEVSRGTLVVFHGLLPHYSAANLSTHSRHAYTLHVTDGISDYHCNNWLQTPQEELTTFISQENP